LNYGFEVNNKLTTNKYMPKKTYEIEVQRTYYYSINAHTKEETEQTALNDEAKYTDIDSKIINS